MRKAKRLPLVMGFITGKFHGDDPTQGVDIGFVAAPRCDRCNAQRYSHGPEFGYCTRILTETRYDFACTKFEAKEPT